MDSENRQPLYPKIIDSDEHLQRPVSTSATMYPSLDMSDMVNNLFPNTDDEKDDQHRYSQLDTENSQSFLREPPVEELLLRLPGAILHLIDKKQSVEIGCGDFTVVRLRQGEIVVAVLVRVGDDVQWPLARDEACVRLDDSHYFFSLHVPDAADNAKSDDILNYGLTFASKGQEKALKDLDVILEQCTSFSMQKVVIEKEADGSGAKGVMVGTVARETSPEEMAMVEGSEKKEVFEKEASVYWTTLAPNVEDYSSSAAKLIAKGSGHLIRGILWCGNVTVDRLNWGNQFMMKRIKSKSQSEINPDTLKRIQRVKKITKMTEKVANGVLSGVLKVSGFFTSSIVNSKLGKKFFSLLPGEVILASLDGFSRVCDSVEIVGKDVLSTTSTVTTGLVSERYGEQAGEATSSSMSAAGHAFATAWTVFKIRKALNPKSSVKTSTLLKSSAKAAAAEYKSRKNP